MQHLANKLVWPLRLCAATARGPTKAEPRVLVRQADATTGQVLMWDGSKWAPQDIATKVFREESFAATASQTNFTIAYSAPAVSGTSVPLRVYRNGVRLFWVASGPTINQFTYSGTSVTTAANAVNDIITVEYLN